MNTIVTLTSLITITTVKTRALAIGTSWRHLVNTIVTSHARTVVRECCKGDDESQWERVKFDPPPPKNPLTDGHQNLRT